MVSVNSPVDASQNGSGLPPTRSFTLRPTRLLIAPDTKDPRDQGGTEDQLGSAALIPHPKRCGEVFFFSLLRPAVQGEPSYAASLPHIDSRVPVRATLEVAAGTAEI